MCALSPVTPALQRKPRKVGVQDGVRPRELRLDDALLQESCLMFKSSTHQTAAPYARAGFNGLQEGYGRMQDKRCFV